MTKCPNSCRTSMFFSTVCNFVLECYLIMHNASLILKYIEGIGKTTLRQLTEKLFAKLFQEVVNFQPTFWTNYTSEKWVTNLRILKNNVF